MSNNDGKIFRGRRVRCPHCDEDIYVDFSVRVEPIGRTEQDVLGEHDWTDTLLPAEKEFVQEASSNGMLEAYRNVVSRIVERGFMSKPNNIHKAFLNAMKRLVPMGVPTMTWHRLKESGIEGHQLRFMKHNQIAVLLEGNDLIAFVEVVVVAGNKIGGKHSRRRISPNVKDLNLWLRTRYGYVQQKSRLFIGELLEAGRKTGRQAAVPGNTPVRRKNS